MLLPYRYTMDNWKQGRWKTHTFIASYMTTAESSASADEIGRAFVPPAEVAEHRAGRSTHWSMAWDIHGLLLCLSVGNSDIWVTFRIPERITSYGK